MRRANGTFLPGSTGTKLQPGEQPQPHTSDKDRDTKGRFAKGNRAQPTSAEIHYCYLNMRQMMLNYFGDPIRMQEMLEGIYALTKHDDVEIRLAAFKMLTPYLVGKAATEEVRTVHKEETRTNINFNLTALSQPDLDQLEAILSKPPVIECKQAS